jgi:hypothetical protein
MTIAERDLRCGDDILIRKVDSHLATLRAGLHGADLRLAERLADSLRHLIVDTAGASAADRARVRVAVHYFVLRRESRGHLISTRSLAAAQRLINKVADRLNRPDLVVAAPADTDRPTPARSTARPR